MSLLQVKNLIGFSFRRCCRERQPKPTLDHRRSLRLQTKTVTDMEVQVPPGLLTWREPKWIVGIALAFVMLYMLRKFGLIGIGGSVHLPF